MNEDRLPAWARRGGGGGAGPDLGGGGRVGLSSTPLSVHWSCANQVHSDVVK